MAVSVLQVVAKCFSVHIFLICLEVKINCTRGDPSRCCNDPSVVYLLEPGHSWCEVLPSIILCGVLPHHVPGIKPAFAQVLLDVRRCLVDGVLVRLAVTTSNALRLEFGHKVSLVLHYIGTNAEYRLWPTPSRLLPQPKLYKISLFPSLLSVISL